MNYSMIALTHWVATNKEGEQFFCVAKASIAHQVILDLSQAGAMEINYYTFYILLTERDVKNVELSTPDLDKELIIR